MARGGQVTITPSPLEKGIHWDEWEPVIRDLENAGYDVRVLAPEEERGGLPSAPEYYVVAYLFWKAVGEPAIEGAREAVRERVRESVLRHLKGRKGKPQVVVLVDERNRPIAEIELPAEDR